MNIVPLPTFAALVDYKDSGILLLDVREKDEYREGHIENVENIPLTDLEKHKKELQNYEHICIHCLSGKRSMEAALIVQNFGFGVDISVFEGGIVAWRESGRVLE